MWSKCANVTLAVSLVLATWKLVKKYVTSIFDSNLFIKTKKSQFVLVALDISFELFHEPQ